MRPVLYLFLGTVAASAFAEDFKQSEPLPKAQYPAAYNAPSQVKLQNSEGKWLPDLFIDASFLYYHADEDGLDIATSAALTSSGAGFVVVGTSNAQIIFQDFEYKPGFKVGIGGRFCEWTLSGEYTWIRQTTHKNRSSAPNPNLAGATGVWLLDDWFQQLSPTGQSISANSFSTKWHLAVDLADLMLSRPFYQGRYLSISPAVGLRGAWIRQNMNVNIQIPTDVVASQRSPTTTSSNSSHSWAVGPRAALEADCLLGMGFRLQGEMAGSLLYTQYTRVLHSENVASTASLPPVLQTQCRNEGTVRAVGELGLGLGWGSYFCGQKYHFDFAATYDFLVFWNQNMMRNLLEITTEGVGNGSGNLNLHGLTLTARFDF